MTRQRLAIAISSSTAAIFLAVGLSAAGFGPLPRQAPLDGQVESVAAGVADDQSIATPTPEVVYIAPAPSPRTVVVPRRVAANGQATRKASDASKRRSTRAVRRDDDEREHEREHDDDREREHEREHDDDRERERDDD